MRALLLITVIALSACGFHPVYGVNKYTAIGAEEKLQQVEIAGIPDREGQFLRNALIDRFYRSGRPASPEYRLTLTAINEQSRDLDITVDSDSTRGQLQLKTRMKLTDKNTQTLLLDRQLRAIASYNIIESEFANRVSKQNTRENLLEDLARQIEEQLALYFKRTP